MSALTSGIHAALLLARGQGSGLAVFDREKGAAWEMAASSFWALPAALPGYVAIHAIDWVIARDAGGEAFIGRAFALELMGFVVGWLAFAVMSHRVAERAGRSALWPRFIAAWNWCNVVQYMMLVTASLPALLGAPSWVVQACWLVAIGWAMWLEWFTTRLALAVSGRFAVGMVALDIGLGIAIAVVSAGFG